MTERELRKLNRTDLLELMLQQSRELDQLRLEIEQKDEELEAARQQLTRREIAINEAGSIAEASLMLNGVFTAAENACAQYMENIKSLSLRQEELCIRREQETQRKCEQMLSDAQRQVDLYWKAIQAKVDKLLDAQR